MDFFFYTFVNQLWEFYEENAASNCEVGFIYLQKCRVKQYTTMQRYPTKDHGLPLLMMEST